MSYSHTDLSSTGSIASFCFVCGHQMSSAKVNIFYPSFSYFSFNHCNTGKSGSFAVEASWTLPTTPSTMSQSTTGIQRQCDRVGMWEREYWWSLISWRLSMLRMLQEQRDYERIDWRQKWCLNMIRWVWKFNRSLNVHSFPLYSHSILNNLPHFVLNIWMNHKYFVN